MTVRILNGDCRDVLKTLPSDSVHCCVTSPPYFGLRDYGVAGQIGLEPTPDEFVAAMVEVFREVRRVLRPDGTLWLNLGDSYAGSGRGGNPEDSPHQKQASNRGSRQFFQSEAVASGAIGRKWVAPPAGYKQKDLIGIPWMVAFALRADGWWLRQRLPWVKRNPMPESTQDRPTSAIEEMFQFAKNGREPLLWRHAETRLWVESEPTPDYVWVHRNTNEESRVEKTGKDWRRVNLWKAFDYFYDYDAVKLTMAPSSVGRLAQDVESQEGSARANGGAKTNGKMKAVGGDKQRGHSRRRAGFNDRWDKMEREEQRGERAFRNTDLFFASLDAPHGAIGNGEEIIALDIATHSFKEAHFATFPPALIEPCIKAGCPAGGMVLDPFGGAGTTGMVADRLGRDAILIELNPEYAAIAKRRIIKDAGLLADVREAAE